MDLIWTGELKRNGLVEIPFLAEIWEANGYIKIIECHNRFSTAEVSPADITGPSLLAALVEVVKAARK